MGLVDLRVTYDSRGTLVLQNLCGSLGIVDLQGTYIDYEG